MVRLTLVAHAATAATRAGAFPADEPVDAGELAYVPELAPLLCRVQQAWTSPARRARQTAEALALAAEPELALADLDVGHWTGRRLVDLEREEPEALAHWLSDPDARPHGGETLVELSGRVGEWLGQVAASGNRTVAVTHAAVIRAALVHVLRAPSHAFWRIDVPPLSVSIFTGSGDRWNLRMLGAPARLFGADSSDLP